MREVVLGAIIGLVPGLIVGRVYQRAVNSHRNYLEARKLHATNVRRLTKLRRSRNGLISGVAVVVLGLGIVVLLLISVMLDLPGASH